MSLPRVLTSRELWYLAAGPATWLLHFIVLYAAAAIICARPSVAMTGLGRVNIIASALALAAAAVVAYRGIRTLRESRLPGDERGLEFIGRLLLGLAAVTAGGILVTAAVPFLAGACR